MIFLKGKGFTLLEIIIVTIIIMSLSVTAISVFINLREQAQKASEANVSGAVRSGIGIYFSAYLAYPDQLDDATTSPASLADPYFDVVIEGGITGDWEKGITTYLDQTGPLYIGPAGGEYFYDSTTGIFKKIGG